MKKAGIIVNPLAKKVRTGRISLKSLEDYDSNSIKIDLTRSKEELKEVVARYRQEKYDYIGITGGDGSLHVALSEIINTYGSDNVPPVLTFCAGTMNNVAKSIGNNGKTINILNKMDDLIASDRDPEIIRRGTIKVGDKYCFLFGLGAVTKFLNAAYSGGEKGFLRNAVVVCRAIGQGLMGKEEGTFFEKIPAEVTADGKVIEFKGLMALLAATVEHIGMSFTPFLRALENPQAFQAIITSLPPRYLVSKILSLRSGRAIIHPNHRDDIYRELIIKSSEPFDYTMDGDLYSTEGTLKVETGPVLNFIKI